MPKILIDVFDVSVFDAKSKEKLFEVTTALDNRFELSIEYGEGKLMLKHCYFEASVLNDIGSGKYKDRQLFLELRAVSKDSETYADSDVRIFVENAKVTSLSYESTENRMMVNNLEFKILLEDMTSKFKVEVIEVEKDHEI